MKQLNVPKKLTSQIQIWTSVLLLVIATILSFTPIITLQTTKNAEDINEMLVKVAPDANLTIPETVDVSAIKIVKSIGVGAKIIKATMNAAKSVTSEDDANQREIEMDGKIYILNEDGTLVEKTNAAADLGSEIAAILDTDEGKETILIALSLASTVASNFDTKDMSGSGVLASVLTMLITLIALIALLVLTFVIPIMLLVSTVAALISALTNLSTPEEVATKISRKLPGFISLPFTLMLFQCVVPGMTYGSGIAGICIVTILSAVLGLVVSRLRTYDGAAFRYLNIVQGVSALGIVGFVVFFFNLVKTNILTGFLHGKFADYVASVAQTLAAAAKIKGAPKPEINNSYLVDLALIVVYVCFALASVTYLEKCVQRLACSASANKKGAFPKDTCIVRAVLMIAVYALPTYIMGQKHFYNDPTSKAAVGDESLLVLGTEQSAALTMVLVGIILMLVAEVALIVLKIMFCKGMNSESMAAIMSGDETAAAEAETVETTETETAEAAEEVAEETVEEATEAATEDATEEVTQ